MFERDLEEFAKTLEGAFLREFDYRSIPVRTGGRFPASYNAVTDSITIRKDGDEAVLFGSLCHEYRHAWQRRKMGLIRYSISNAIAKIPEMLGRDTMIEKEAKTTELASVLFYGEQKIKKWKELKCRIQATHS